jgi:predicted HicB family RNase H-like nuclease
MTQVTLRIPDELLERLKQASREHGRSLNSWASAVLAAAVDPEYADDETQRIRERLARAGLLLDVGKQRRRRADAASAAQARAAAARGRSLSDIVAEGRG